MSIQNFDYSDWEERIADYINETMTQADRIQFEKDMADTLELKKAVELDKALHQRASELYLFEHLKPLADDYVKEKFPEYHPQAKKENANIEPLKKSPLSIKLILSVLSVLLLVGLGFFYNNYQKRENHRQIISKWLTQKPLSYDNTNLADFQTGNDSLAIVAYIQRQYDKAESLFLTNDSRENNAFGPRGLYRAVNALMTTPPKTDIAIELLARRYDNKNTFLYDAVEWYLALAYLQKKDIENAQKILRNVSDNSVYNNEARQLLKDIEQSNF
jgi:hypothetical protein